MSGFKATSGSCQGGRGSRNGRCTVTGCPCPFRLNAEPMRHAQITRGTRSNDVNDLGQLPKLNVVGSIPIARSTESST